MTDESTWAVANRAMFESKIEEVGRILATIFPPGYGFAIFAYQLGGDRPLAFVANAEREDVARMVEGWLGQAPLHEKRKGKS